MDLDGHPSQPLHLPTPEAATRRPPLMLPGAAPGIMEAVLHDGCVPHTLGWPRRGGADLWR